MRILPCAVLLALTACATSPKSAPPPQEDEDIAPGEATAAMKDEKSAEEICKGGAGDMCSALADHTFRRAKTDEQRRKALQYAQEGCALNDGAGCSITGWAHEWGKAGPVDLKKAILSYQRGCTINDGRSCVKAATLLSFGPLSLRNLKQARAHAAKACSEAKDEEGCKLDAKLKAEPLASETNACSKKSAVGGDLTRQEISDVIKWHGAEVRDCFDRALQGDPKLQGRIEVAWTIDCAGAVTKLKTAESSLPKSVEECVHGNVKAWKFPASRNGGSVDISFPWVLKPTAAK